MPQAQPHPVSSSPASGSRASHGDRARRRQLAIEDSLKLSALLAITLALAFVTWLLFQSFTRHRHLLELRWSQRGQQALNSGRYPEAIEDFRAALELAPANRSYLLSLADALAATPGRTVEAAAYFNTLRESQPGNARVNLQLARLSAGEQNTPRAIEYYRAAIYGTWEGDGSVQRLETRLELIRYLISSKDFGTARTELLIAEGNAPDGPSPLRIRVLSEIAPLFEQINAPGEARVVYRAILTLDRGNPPALLGAARAASASGNYREANTWLDRLLSLNPPPSSALVSLEDARDLLDQNRRILAIAPLPSLEPGERAARVLRGLAVAHDRLIACLAAPDPPVLTDLGARWQTAYPATPVSAAASSLPAKPPPAQPAAPVLPTRSALAGEIAANSIYAQNLWRLVADTEIQTAAVCGQPTGADTALLSIARIPFFQD